MRSLLQRGRALIGEHVAKRGLILLYHSIEDAAADPFGMHVSPVHFEEHLAVIRRRCTPLSVGELAQRALNGTMPLRPVALSFDDGYANNAYAALPLLSRHEIPATFFVASGFVDSADECWWDSLERLLLLPGQLQPELVVRVQETEHRWSLGEFARLSTDDVMQFAAWAPWQAETPTARHAAFRALIAALQYASTNVRVVAIESLQAQAVEVAPPRSTRRGLASGELRTLAASPLAEIGAHTVSHPSLAALSAAEQEREVVASRAALRAITGQPISSFAYPYGQRADYSDRTIETVRDAGFDAACVNEPGYVKRDTDSLQLPRFWVADWDGPTFERYLSRWLAEAYGV